MFINSMTSQGDVICATKSLSPAIHPGRIYMEPCCPLVKRKGTVCSLLSNKTNECVGVHKEEKMTMTILKEERVRVVDFKATCTSFH